jgi:hypothetical protein
MLVRISEKEDGHTVVAFEAESSEEAKLLRKATLETIRRGVIPEIILDIADQLEAMGVELTLRDTR